MNHELIDEARKLANSNVQKNHVWMNMTDLELLKSAGLYKKNPLTGEEGITLAGVMLFGKNETILRVNTYCRTDALLRIDDLDRYDDRDFVETNLLNMYHRLFEFVTKHTKDRFLLEDGTQRRVSARNIMARELIINMLIHRDITSGYLSRIIIYKDKLVCKNPNGFKTMRLLTNENYTPFAKNPTLAKFFREIGYADELGSGIRKITKYSLLYSGCEPIFEDKEIFKVTIPLNKGGRKSSVKRYKGQNDSVKVKNEENDRVNDILTSSEIKILTLVQENNNLTTNELSTISALSSSQINRILKSLKEKEYIKRKGSDKTGYWEILK